MTAKSKMLIGAILMALVRPSPWASGHEPGRPQAEASLEQSYTDRLDELRAELSSRISKKASSDPGEAARFLSRDTLDAKLVEFVVLHEATPAGLAAFAEQGREHRKLIDRLLADAELMQQMLVADGAKAPRAGRNGLGPAQYGPAMKIYTEIQKASRHAREGVLQRLALAISLEHAVPIAQTNAVARTDAPQTVDPVARYLHYEKAFLGGELDAAFDRLSTWELRLVVNGDEPDDILAWGREMLRNFRPDHVVNPSDGWRYVGLVTSDVKYGSGDVKHDKPELQKYQNILMNGGVCGRRAFIGRFILRAFGIPTIARPSRGHGALAHWTPGGWVVNLGGGWGSGWTNTPYHNDLDFLATSQARGDRKAFLRVKRAQWIGDVLGEKRSYGEHDGEPAFWNGVSLRIQRAIIEESKAVALEALGEDLGEANEPTVAQKVLASPVTAEDRRVSVGEDGVLTIPAAAYSKPSGNTRDVIAMKSFAGGLQVFLPRFFPQGQTVLRGGTWKGDAEACMSGRRMLSGGYGRYENWGLRAAMTPVGPGSPRTRTLDLGDGVTMEMVYIRPGTFVMGGERTTDGRFECVEVPKHEVRLSQGFYLGKHEVTQAQYEAVMGTNPSRSTKGPDCPVDNVGEQEAWEFCTKLSEWTGQDVRLPTEAEWEYAARAGTDTRWSFGDDPSKLGEYAWFKENAGGRSHPVGTKRPNPWGLHDIHGNVCERISDKYSRSYYSTSPKVDPTGPSQGVNSRLEYRVEVPRSGKYTLTARVVTANEGQRLKVSVGEDGAESVVELPFTVGSWQESTPLTLSLEAGQNLLRFWRDDPPQYGMAVKEFRLEPAR